MATSDLYKQVESIGAKAIADTTALIAKRRKEREDMHAKYLADEQKLWDENKDKWIAEGYTRESDPNNAWGSKWSYKGNTSGNSSSGNSGNSGNSGKVNPGLGSKSGSGNVPTPVDKTVSTEQPPLLGGGGMRHVANASIGSDSSGSSNVQSSDLPVAFQYRFKLIGADGEKIAGLQPTIDTSKYNIINVAGNPDIEDEHGNTWAKVNDSDKYALLRLGKNYTGSLKVGDMRRGGYENGTRTINFSNGRTKEIQGTRFVTFDKQGGTMNKVKYFQQGGQAQNIEQQVIALVQAAMSGDQKATQQVNQIMEAAKAGDQQAVQIAQMIQAVAQKMQGQATAAKWGSKLQYIRSLKFAKGGKTCPACMSDGGSAPEKLQNKKQKMHVNPNDTVHVKGQPKSLTNSDGSRVDKRFPAYTAKDYQNDKKTKDGQKRRMKADLVSSEKCGGTTPKAKKHYFGGWL